MGSYDGRAWGLGSTCASLEIKLDFPKFSVRCRLIGKGFKEWGWIVYNFTYFTVVFYCDAPGQGDFEYRKNLEKKKKRRRILMHGTSLMRNFMPILTLRGFSFRKQELSQWLGKKLTYFAVFLCKSSLSVATFGLNNNLTPVGHLGGSVG